MKRRENSCKWST